MTIDEMQQVLSQLADELPEGFFRELNGGIIIVPEIKYHPQAYGQNLFIMGEYVTDTFMGRQIKIYYGSFEQVHHHTSPEVYRDALRATLRHEFRHHVEGLSRLMDLELEDKRQIERYLSHGAKDAET